MKKYEIYKFTAEIGHDDRYQIKEGCTLRDEYPEFIESFENEAEAAEALKKYGSDITYYEGGKCYEITEYAIEENTYFADGDIDNMDIGKITPMEITVIDDDDKVIGTFDSFESADRCWNDLDAEAHIEAGGSILHR